MSTREPRPSVVPKGRATARLVALPLSLGDTRCLSGRKLRTSYVVALGPILCPEGRTLGTLHLVTLCRMLGAQVGESCPCGHPTDHLAIVSALVK